MEVVLIVGDDNSGKSTLVRSLSGIGRGNHKHPSSRNIAELNWANNQESLSPQNTLCLISSLNEGEKYSLDNPRFTGDPKQPFRKGYTIAPRDLVHILDTYSSGNFGTEPCRKAILCISTSVNTSGWTVKCYFKHVVNGMFGQNTLTHIIKLNQPKLDCPSGPKCVDLPSKSHPRNAVAALARLEIGLQ